MMEKVGFFLCTGCGIGESVDDAGLLKTACKEGKAQVARSHARLCAPEGLTLVRDEMAAAGLDAVVIAACSERELSGVFRFGDAHVERASLREQVAWVCKAEAEDRQMLAEDYTRMACVRAAKSARPTRLTPAVSRRLLVVGGGAAGLSAALEASRAGYEVVLVDKDKTLGGWMATCKLQVPRKAPFAAAEDNDILELVGAVKDAPGIQIKSSCAIGSISGAPGAFQVTLQGEAEPFTVGAIVVAVGATPYDVTKLGHLGYGTHPNVITQSELEALAKQGQVARPSDGKPIQSALFVQCAGSRDEAHLGYCSTTCCPETIKQLAYLKAANGAVRCHVVHKDMRLPGLLEAFYRSAQADGTEFVQGEIKAVSSAGQGVRVELHDAQSGEQRQLEVDLVVLATGMVPSAKDTSVLNLTYRLGKELPTRDSGFASSHFICFPYETQRTGIYAAGAVHRPMLTADAMADGAGAAHKAIQCVEMTARGEAVHPRAGDLTYPEFSLQRCTQCKRCTEECPFGTLDEDEKGTPKPNPERCRRCGVCLGACPERIVSFANYSVDMVGSMIKSISVPDEFEEKPRVLCLVCENDVLPAIDMAASLRKPLSPWVRVVALRCLGSTNLQWLNDSMIKGIDGVMLIGCRHGDDYQCHFVKGSELCNVRMEKIQETLTRLMLEPERIRVEQFALGDYGKLFDVVNGFVERVVALGPNPNKG
ncbi:MAG: hydrogenase iron-sulfur subunit [Deltaproteobacteria bacterium]|nr:hydrogenase iron-sulfur subunit [Deltaproteobacteria bacterium]